MLIDNFAQAIYALEADSCTLADAYWVIKDIQDHIDSVDHLSNALSPAAVDNLAVSFLLLNILADYAISSCCNALQMW